MSPVCAGASPLLQPGGQQRPAAVLRAGRYASHHELVVHTDMHWLLVALQRIMQALAGLCGVKPT